MAKITGARAVVECILEQGVGTVFGIPGGAVLPLYDELGKNSRKLLHVLCAHEQGAAHAADGYARASGNAGVAIATSGPGATNLVTGIATAWMDSSPVVFITGNIPSSRIGTDSFQEVDIVGVTIPVTKHNMLVRRAQDIPRFLRAAFRIAKSGRPGPVLVDIAHDAFTGIFDFSAERTETSAERFEAVPGDLLRAAELIRLSHRPLVLAGGGVHRSGAGRELANFVRASGAPVVTTLMGIGAYPGGEGGSLGHIGAYGHPEANRAVAECDLLIAVGTRFSDRTLSTSGGFFAEKKVLHIDIDLAEINKNIPAAASVIGDAADVLRGLTSELGAADAKAPWFTPSGSGDSTYARSLVEAVQSASPGAPVVTDVGEHQMWVALYGRFGYPGQLITSGGTGTMGFGLGAATGACCARPGQTHFLVTGDGGILMNCGELSTVSRLGLPLVTVVFNNRALGMVRRMQNEQYRGRRAYSDTNPPDFAALASSFGITGYKADSAEALARCAALAVKSGRPALIDCAVPPD